jgi:ABC-2 type transport system permease protein
VSMRTLRKMTWMEVKLLVREPLTIVFTFGFPFLVLMVLGQVFGNSPDPEQPEVFRGVGPMDYYLPGYIGLSIAAIGLIALPVHLASYRERGVLKRFRASGISATVVVGAQAIVTALAAVAGAALLTVLGFLGYDVHAPESLGGVLLGFLATVACFASIGVLLGAVMPSARAAQGIGLMLFFAMMFLSGTDGPREVLGDVLRGIGEAFPLTHSFIVMQDPWIGFGVNAGRLALVLAITVCAGLAAVRAFRWE